MSIVLVLMAGACYSMSCILPWGPKYFMALGGCATLLTIFKYVMRV